MLKKLTDRVYYMDYVQRGDRPVLGLVIGDRYSLVIDGGNSKEHATEFLEYASRLNISPLKYLVLTHWHWDHVFGIETMNLLNIVNDSTNVKLNWMRKLEWTDKAIDERVANGEEIDFCREHMKIAHPDNNREINIPKGHVFFDKEFEIDLGGVTVKVENLVCDHSEDSCIVHIDEEKVTFLGDAMYLDMYNKEWSYSREKLYPLLDNLLEKNSDYYVPAHHDLYTNEGFKNFASYIKKIGDIVDDEVSLDEVEHRFMDKYSREVTSEEVEDMKAFINGNIKKHRALK